MDPVSSVDQLVLLLRQRLTERSRAADARPTGRPEARAGVAPSAIETARALAAIEGLDERQLRRTVLQSLLADQFGAHLLNDAQFQQVVDRVAETIEDEDAASRLLSQVLVELRTAAG